MRSGLKVGKAEDGRMEVGRKLNDAGCGKIDTQSRGCQKVTGKAHYSGDLNLPGTLWGRCLRSPIAYGRIKSIDISKASKVPGVKAVITGAGRRGTCALAGAFTTRP